MDNDKHRRRSRSLSLRLVSVFISISVLIVVVVVFVAVVVVIFVLERAAVLCEPAAPLYFRTCESHTLHCRPLPRRDASENAAGPIKMSRGNESADHAVECASRSTVKTRGRRYSRDICSVYSDDKRYANVREMSKISKRWDLNFRDLLYVCTLSSFTLYRNDTFSSFFCF